LSYATAAGRLKLFRLTEIWPSTFGDIFMKQSLVQDALKTVQSPQVLVNIISKRVRQLGQGFRPLVAFDPKLTFMDVALKEVAEGKLGYEMIEVPSAAGTSTTPVPAKKSRKTAAAA
jgi:DNA-directed RNA polymerase subunit omega